MAAFVGVRQANRGHRVNAREHKSRRRPRKRFGQHFLVDRPALERIASLVQPAEDCRVLEVGPGRGALTELLTARFDRLIAVEIDRDLAAELRDRFGGPGFRLIETDVLQLDFETLTNEEQSKGLFVVGNIAYNISAPLLFHLLRHAGSVDRAVLTLQREVARRLVASPGNKEYGLPTLLLAMHAKTQTRMDLGPRSFRPQPRVNSTVVEIEFKRECQQPVLDEQLFERVVRTAFSKRRKMLRNSLLAMIHHESGNLDEIGQEAGIDLQRRPETLSLQEFGRLSDSFARFFASLGAPEAR